MSSKGQMGKCKCDGLEEENYIDFAVVYKDRAAMEKVIIYSCIYIHSYI